MKRYILLLLAGLAVTLSCNDKVGTEDGDGAEVKDPITMEFPTPTTRLWSVELTDQQKGFVRAGNDMAFRLMGQMYEGKSMILSPLSLEMALAMCANGASGETLAEMVEFLGFGDDIDALNTFCKTLLEQLPAVDLDVKLKLTDALLVREDMKLLPSYQQTVENHYYAAVENCSFADPAAVAARVNEWASRSTDGFIKDVLSARDITPQSVALIMNALYFKASWAENTEFGPQFTDARAEDSRFTLANGQEKQLPTMVDVDWFRYIDEDEYFGVQIPYNDGKFCMYLLMPVEKDVEWMLDELEKTSWSGMQAKFRDDAEVYLWMPKFSVEERYELNDALKALGLEKAFQAGEAQFDRMFDVNQDLMDFYIGKVIQKARISVDEWGTEAAAVTVIGMEATSPGPGEEPKRVYLHFARPFVFLIAERTSGTILFEGVYTGE